MKIRILCVGRMKDGPERELLDDYLDRARKTGSPLGVRGVDEVEVASGGGMDAEGQRLIAKRSGGVLIRLDERGETWTSQDLSRRLARWRDSGEPSVDFAIGGADGLAASVAADARHAVALGAFTWPHRLVRVLIAEQVYRALSIEAGAPYHRE